MCQKQSEQLEVEVITVLQCYLVFTYQTYQIPINRVTKMLDRVRPLDAMSSGAK